MAAPTVQAVGTFQTATTAALTVTLPSHAADDVLILFGISAAAMAAPSGWTAAPNGSIGASGAFTDIYYKVATSSSETNPTYAAAANHVGVLPVVIRGADPASPFNTSAQRGESTPFVGSVRVATGAAITTTVADCLVLAHMGTPQDTATGAVDAGTEVNADLSSLTLRWNAGTNLGNGSTGALISGIRAVAGAIAGTVADSNTQTSFRYNHVTLALQPPGGGITGTASITEDPDTVSATGVLPIIGTATISEAADTLSATGTLPIIGTASITEDADTLTATGSGAAPGIVGTANITEDPDTVSATGALRIAGTASITEGADTVTSSGALAIKGQASITESDDTSTATGVLPIKGVASVTEDADTLVATGSVASAGITGSASITEADDTVSATGQLAIRGTASITEAADTVTATAQIADPLAGVAEENRLFAPRIRRALRSPDVVRRLDSPGVSRRLLSAEIARSLQAPAIKRKLYS